AAMADLASKRRAPSLPSQPTRVTDPRFHDRGGPALLFEKPIGSEVPVLINAFGSYRRMEMAMGLDKLRNADGFEELAAKIGELVKPQPPRSLSEAIAKAKQFAPLLKIGPKRKKGPGLCQEVVRTEGDIDLTKLPILRCWPLDGDYESVGYPAGINHGISGLGHPDISNDEWNARYRGRYITLAGIHTIYADDIDDPKPASHNIGMYRVQLLGKDRVAMHWHIHHDGARHWRSWKKRGEPMPVAIVLGGPSVLPYAATAPLPPGISELLMAGFLNSIGGDGGMRLVRAKTVPLWIPADAEMVIEGYVSNEAGNIGWDPREPDAGPLGPDAVFEGPFGDHTGFYSMPDRYPIVRVTAVTHRRDPIYPTTVVGLPPQEDYFLGKATERLFLPLLKVLIPDVEDYDLPIFGAFHNCASIEIAKAYPMQGRRVMHSIWGAGQMAWTKTIFVTEPTGPAAADVHDSRSVLEACARWCDPLRDVELVNGPLDILDHAAPRLGAGTKLGFDCTAKWTGEEVGGRPVSDAPKPRHWATGDELERYLEAVRAIDGIVNAAMPTDAPGWLVVSADRDFGEPGKQGVGARIRDAVLAVPCDQPPPYVVVVGRSVDVTDADEAMFHWLANADASRDAVRIDHATGGRMAFDATPKELHEELGAESVRAWPPILSMPDDVAVQASQRLKSLGYTE
ncbi:MAG: UbiD family decarboxylase domain-containing protein, partial [Planctomycetota bacterium]